MNENTNAKTENIKNSLIPVKCEVNGHLKNHPDHFPPTSYLIGQNKSLKHTYFETQSPFVCLAGKVKKKINRKKTSPCDNQTRSPKSNQILHYQKKNNRKKQSSVVTYSIDNYLTIHRHTPLPAQDNSLMSFQNR